MTWPLQSWLVGALFGGAAGALAADEVRSMLSKPAVVLKNRNRPSADAVISSGYPWRRAPAESCMSPVSSQDDVSKTRTCS